MVKRITGITKFKTFLNKAVVTFFYLAQLITFILLLLPILNLHIPIWWLDNLLNLQIQWSFIACILLIVNLSYVKQCRRLFSTITLALILHNFMPLYFPSSHIFHNSVAPTNNNIIQPPSTELSTHVDIPLTIAQLNLSYDNPNLQALVPVLGNKDFDLLIIQEASDRESRHIKAIGRYYPYSFGLNHLEATPSGMAIFSRFPIIEKKLHSFGGKGGQVLEVIIQMPISGVPIQLYAIHPSSPRSEALWLSRNQTLTTLSSQILNSPFINRIVVGDFNNSPWTHSFKVFQQKSQLKNSADGFGYAPSWSLSNKTFLSMLSSVYIDHVLVSEPFNILNKNRQFISGSDHLLLVTKTSIRILQ